MRARHGRGQRRVVGERLVDRDRVGVEVEEPPHPRDERREVAERGEPGLDLDRGAALGLREREQRRAAREPQRALEAALDRPLHARDGAHREPGEDAVGVEGLAGGQSEPHMGAAVRGRLRRRPCRAGAVRRVPQLERAAVVDLSDRLVELPHTAEARGERDVGRRHARGEEQRARRLRPVRPGEGEGARAELGAEHPGEVAGGVAEPGGETGHALALDDAVGDEAHRAGGEVVAEVPLGGAGDGVGEAALAGAEAGLVGGRRGEVERHVRGLGGDGRAARPAVDAGGVHPRDELPVEAGVTGAHRPVPLGEDRVGERGLVAGGGPLRAVGGEGHGSSLPPSADIDSRKSDTSGAARLHPCRTRSSNS